MEQEMMPNEAEAEAACAVESVPAEPEAPPDDGQALALLRAQFEELKAVVAGLVPKKANEDAMTDAFRALYPDVGREELPDEVWEAARGGLPLEAAYALYERRESLRRTAAEAVNKKNAAVAWGRADREEDGFLSPDEVRDMTPAEVRANLARITASMKHWS